MLKKLLMAVLASALIMAGCGKAETAVTSKEPEIKEVISEITVSVSKEAVEEEKTVLPETVRIGGLKGPTSIGLLALKDDCANNMTNLNYEFVMAAAADEITTALVKGELDIALIPANVASVLYNKTEGGISVIDINTLGVLYFVSGDESVKTPADLEGRTVYLTGKGTTPDYVLQFILEKNGLTDKVSLEYKSEASEVAAVLGENPGEVGMLPQPFVTAACSKNEALKVIMSTEEEWNKLVGDSGSRLVTGVTVVKNSFLKEYPDAVKLFLDEHKSSVDVAHDDVDRVAKLAVENEIIAAEGVAKKAIPACNISFITGEEMKNALEGYLGVLFDSNPASVGGNMPDEDFYYIEK